MGGVGDFFEDVVEDVGGFFEDVAEDISGFAEDVAEDVSLFVEDITEGFGIPAATGWMMGDIPEPDIPDFAGYSPTYADKISNTMGESVPIARAYGRCKIGGNIARIEEGTNDGDDIGHYAVVYAHCQGPVSGVLVSGTSDKYWINNKLLNDLGTDDIHPGVHTFYSGTTNQNDAGAPANVANYAVRACAYRGAAYTLWDFKKIHEVGNKPTCVIEGDWLKVTPIGGEKGNSGASYTNNPAHVLYDFYVNVEGYDVSQLDTTTFTTLETHCNTEGFTFNFCFDNNASINDAKKLIWKSYHGASVWSQGLIKPVWESATGISHIFTMDNIVENSLNWSQPKRPNIVRVHHLDSDDNYRKTYAEVSDDLSIEDKGKEIWEETCNWITGVTEALMRAQFKFDKFKYTDYGCRLTGFSDSQHLEPFDRVTVTHKLPGWTTKDFIVRGKNEDQYGRPKFILEAYYSGLYHGQAAPAQAGYGSDFANPFGPPNQVASVTVTENSYRNTYGTWVPSVVVTYARSPTGQEIWDYGNIYINRAGETLTFIGIDKVDGKGYVISGGQGYFDVNDTVTVAVTAVSRQGVESSLTSATTGQDTLSEPAAPGILTASGSTPIEDGVVFSWQKASEAEVTHYSVRTAIAGGAYSTYEDIHGLAFTRMLILSEMHAAGKARSSVTCVVHAVNVYGGTGSGTTINNYCLNIRGPLIVSASVGLGVYSSVSDAIDALPAVGGEILIKEGTYPVPQMVIPDKDVTIRGINRDTVILQPSASTPFHISNYGNYYHFSDFTIQSQGGVPYGIMFYYEGVEDSEQTPNILIEDINFDLKSDSGFLNTNDDGDWAVYCEEGSGYVTVRNCYIENAKFFLRTDDFNHIVFENNHGVSCGAIVRLNGPGAKGETTALVKSNQFESINGSPGISILAGFPNVKVIDNSLRWTSAVSPTMQVNMLNINASSNPIITGNDLVFDNTVGGCSQEIRGINTFLSSAIAFNNNNIYLNISGSSRCYGVLLDTTTDSVCSGNRIKVLNANHNDFSWGILADSADRNVIDNNSITLGNDAKDIGIGLDAGSNHNIGQNNFIYNAGSGVSDDGSGNTVLAGFA